MNRVRKRKELAPGIVRLEIEAPEIARARRAGQFVILRLHERAERIPLTLVDSDPDAGSIVLAVQAAGAGTEELAALKAGDGILDLVGPLGRPTPVAKVGAVTVIGGGVGAAEALPVIRAWREAGNRVTAIIGARTARMLIFLQELRAAANELHICTEDGTLGKTGLVTYLLNWLINDGRIPDLVYAIGPVPMMKAVADQTRPYGIKTLVSLNPLMVDGTGMCGCCRVTVGEKTKFACVDGPDFDAHQVDFDELRARLGTYRAEEARARELAGGRA